MGELTASESGIAVVHENCTKNTEYPFIFGSPLHVRQIFVNILTNAIKYNKPGGRVYAKIECGECIDNKVVYTCTIEDTGIGMSPEFLEHIFEPFAQENLKML